MGLILMLCHREYIRVEGLLRGRCRFTYVWSFAQEPTCRLSYNLPGPMCASSEGLEFKVKGLRVHGVFAHHGPSDIWDSGICGRRGWCTRHGSVVSVSESREWGQVGISRMNLGISGLGGRAGA